MRANEREKVTLTAEKRAERGRNWGWALLRAGSFGFAGLFGKVVIRFIFDTISFYDSVIIQIMI